MIEYNRSPNARFFLCRQCRAHIALAHEHVHTIIDTDFVIFRNIVNVDVVDDPRRHSIIGMRTAADACCTQCSRLLGLKWIVVPDENMVIQAGRFTLDLRRLLYWDGSRILYAHNRSPVED
ncbi:uncharacterized protein LOC130770812 [Actinidia eriantha]|uniref:uncharacterized protein LOC130770812 n=1 Tax=Actinidia eriantha TaxID=165200 RepID=UPI0025900B99|nr:uncharacterized protein LOC130770812 [Actinidia eriantha]